jgi:hypothetical protein
VLSASLKFTIIQEILVSMVTIQMLISGCRYKLSVRTLLIDASTKLEVVEDIEILAIFRLLYDTINEHKHQDPEHYRTEQSVVLVLRLRFF